MRILKNGYTLAEVLVTIGLVGVVAAITIPMLINNSIEKTIAPSLAKTVFDIEAAFKNIIQVANDGMEDADQSVATNFHTLDAITFNDIFNDDENDDYIVTDSELFSKLQGATGTISLKGEDISYLNNAKIYGSNTLIKNDQSGKYAFINGDNGTIAYRFPKSKALFIYEPSVDDDIENYASQHQNRVDGDVVIARIAIDANSSDGPNRLGQDIFIFGVANNGQLVPAGVEAYNNSIFDGAFNEDVYTDENNGCSGNEVVGDGASCAARVVADGWKINYKK